MGRSRRFDHDEMLELFDTGDWSRVALAQRYDVTDSAINKIIRRRDPRKRDAMNRYSREYQRARLRKPCLGGCGTLVWNQPGRSGYCNPCAGLRRSTTVRPDALLCVHCGEWKGDSDFPLGGGNKARRGRHAACRTCQAAVKAGWRKRAAKPCIACGKPTCPDGRGRRGVDTGLCRPCWQESRRAA